MRYCLSNELFYVNHHHEFDEQTKEASCKCCVTIISTLKTPFHIMSKQIMTKHEVLHTSPNFVFNRFFFIFWRFIIMFTSTSFFFFLCRFIFLDQLLFKRLFFFILSGAAILDINITYLLSNLLPICFILTISFIISFKDAMLFV